MWDTELDHVQLDALKEVSTVAAGNAAKSLSALLGKAVDITVPDIRVEALGKVAETLGAEDNIVTVIHFSISGHISGNILLILSIDESWKLVNVLTGQEVNPSGSLDEMGLSALKELGNITVGAYVVALSQALSGKIAQSVPEYDSDMLGAILDRILAKSAPEEGHAVIVESVLTVEEVVCNTDLVFILRPQTAKDVVSALGV